MLRKPFGPSIGLIDGDAQRLKDLTNNTFAGADAARHTDLKGMVHT